MNNKAQEVNPVGILMAVIGTVATWIMAGRMGAGFFYKLITTIITGVACYFLAWKIADSD